MTEVRSEVLGVGISTASTAIRRPASLKTPCTDLAELDPDFRAILEAALADARAAGLDPQVIETYRSQARQDYLYAQGRSRSGPIVTHAKISKHTTRLAADVCPRVDGKIDWNRRDLFDAWGAIAMRHGLVWGGSFSNYDGPHVQAGWT
jgi:peptidoglycan LD-endopeptidase CwlK